MSTLHPESGAVSSMTRLMANGTTNVHNIEYIDRGYEYLDSKFRGIGASIERVTKA